MMLDSSSRHTRTGDISRCHEAAQGCVPRHLHCEKRARWVAHHCRCDVCKGMREAFQSSAARMPALPAGCGGHHLFQFLAGELEDVLVQGIPVRVHGDDGNKVAGFQVPHGFR